LKKFCIKCGAEESDEVPIIDNLCINCLLNEGKLIKLPSSVNLIVCPICNSIKLGSKWVWGDFKKDFTQILKDVILSNSTFHKELADISVNILESGRNALIHVEGTLRGISIRRDYSVDVVITKELCPHCSLAKGGYYEAIVQVRSVLPFRSKLKEVLIRRISLLNDFIRYVSEVEDLKEGLDIKVLNHGVARRLANSLVREFCGKSSESWKSAGIVSGKKFSKLTISVRLLGLVPGDFIVFKGNAALVEGVSENSVRMKLLETGSTIRVRRDEINPTDITILNSSEYKVVNTYLVNVGDGRALFKDLKRNVTYEAQLTGGLNRELSKGSKVKLLIYKDRAYIIDVRK